MAVRIFAQSPAKLDLARFLTAARTHFSATLEVLGADEQLTSAVLRLESARHGYSGSYRVSARAALEEDYLAADRAEVRGRAAGMATLARRCPSVWEIGRDIEGELDDELSRNGSPNESWNEPPLVNLCAILASVALGPVLPEDGSSLFGVRSSMERLEQLLGQRSLLR